MFCCCAVESQTPPEVVASTPAFGQESNQECNSPIEQPRGEGALQGRSKGHEPDASDCSSSMVSPRDSARDSPRRASPGGDPESGMEGAPNTITTFEVKVSTADGKLGLNCDVWEDCIQVVGLMARGAIEAYNDTSPAWRKVTRNDFITSVNGITGGEAMMEVIRTESSLVMKVVRGVRQIIKVEKGSEVWGVRLTFKNSSSACLRVVEIREGAFLAYNESAALACKVNADNFIVMVNGIAGAANMMYEEFRAAQAVELVLLQISGE